MKRITKYNIGKVQVSQLTSDVAQNNVYLICMKDTFGLYIYILQLASVSNLFVNKYIHVHLMFWNSQHHYFNIHALHRSHFIPLDNVVTC